MNSLTSFSKSRSSSLGYQADLLEMDRLKNIMSRSESVLTEGLASSMSELLFFVLVVENRPGEIDRG